MPRLHGFKCQGALLCTEGAIASWLDLLVFLLPSDVADVTSSCGELLAY